MFAYENTEADQEEDSRKSHFLTFNGVSADMSINETPGHRLLQAELIDRFYLRSVSISPSSSISFHRLHSVNFYILFTYLCQIYFELVVVELPLTIMRLI